MFGTSGIRGQVGEDVTAETALAVGRALGAETESVVVGRDARTSGPLLADALSAGLRECGTDVTDVGVAATPTIARAVGRRGADAGVAVTASHNPPTDNGFKLWNPSGQAFDADQRTRIERRIREEAFPLRSWDALGGERVWDGARDAHLRALGDAVDIDADGITVVVDAGNGPGAITADALYELGCDVETLHAQPDGRFPGRPSEPTAEHCTSLRTYVAATDADVGIAHDGDADRMMAVTDAGEFVAGDTLLALFARAAISASAGTRAVAPLNTSLAVDDYLESVGGELTRTQVGDVYVAAEATADAVAFGGEPSGAWIWPAETLCPDGPLAACKLVELVADRGPLSDVIDEIPAYPLRRESFETGDKRAVMAEVAERVTADHDGVQTLDGLRVETDAGWFLIRASGTQPLVRVTAEGRDQSRCDRLFDDAVAYLQSAPSYQPT